MASAARFVFSAFRDEAAVCLDTRGAERSGEGRARRGTAERPLTGASAPVLRPCPLLCLPLPLPQRRLSDFLRVSPSSITDAASSSSAVSHRSVSPSDFASLLDSLLGETAPESLHLAASAEKRAALELCFRTEVDKAARQMRDAQKSIAEPQLPSLSSASHPLCLLLDAALWGKHAKVLEATAPLAMLEEIIESHSLAISEQIFTNLLVPRSKLLSTVRSHAAASAPDEGRTVFLPHAVLPADAIASLLVDLSM